MVICVSAVITRANSKVSKSMIRDAVVISNGRTIKKGEGARAKCHGTIKAARVAAVAHGVKAAVRAAARGAKVVVNPPRMWMR